MPRELIKKLASQTPPGRPKHEKRRYAVMWTAMMFLLPNFVLGLVSWHLSLNRPLVNLDYGLVILLLVLRRPVLSMISLAVVIGLDIVTTALPVFFIMGEALTLEVILSSLRVLNPVFTAIAAVGTFAISALFIRLLHQRRLVPLRWKASIAVVVLLVSSVAGLDLVNGSSRFKQSGTLLIHTNVAFSAVHRLVVRSVGGGAASDAVEAVPAEGSATYQYLLRRAESISSQQEVGADGYRLAQVVAEHGAASGRNLLIVMVESLGLLKTEATNKSLAAPLLALSKQYEIHSGEVSTTGATLVAEYRELFWLRIHDLSDHTQGHRSLPSVFKDSGYETVAVHGFLSQMFDRKKIYASTGFSRGLFLEDMAQGESVELQGVLLRGIPDRKAAESVRQQLAMSERLRPKLVYWLTLSAHLPVDSRYAAALRTGGGAKIRLDAPESISDHVTILSDVMTSVAAIAADPACGDVDVILVGDHPPPFGSSDLRGHYKSHLVPYFLLIKK